jgi:hypothetical protein
MQKRISDTECAYPELSIKNYEYRMDLLHNIQREIFETVDPKYREWIYGKTMLRRSFYHFKVAWQALEFQTGIYRVTTSAFLFSPTICI